MDAIQCMDLAGNGQRKLLLLGKTGSGKSAICNALIKDVLEPYKKIFPESANCEEGNSGTVLTEVNFLGSSARPFSLVDTVGFDSSVRDTSQVAELIFAVKERCDYINIFAIVMDAPKRIEDSFKNVIRIFEQMFGKDRFWNNAVIIFSNLNITHESIRQRKKKSQISNTLIENFQKAFKVVFKIDKNVPAIILDAHFNPEAEEERQAFSTSAMTLHQWLNCEQNANCSMEDISSVAHKFQGMQGLTEALVKEREKHERAKAKIKKHETKSNKILEIAVVGTAGAIATAACVSNQNINGATACGTAACALVTKSFQDLLKINDQLRNEENLDQ